MNRSPLVTLPVLLAWLALCLPWQICESDCRTAVVGGWQHDCHLPAALGGCAGHCHEEGRDNDPGSGGHQGDDRDGSHTKIRIPVSEPGPADNGPQLSPPCFGVCGCALPETKGLPERIFTRCTGPPGSVRRTLSRIRSVVLLL